METMQTRYDGDVITGTGNDHLEIDRERDGQIRLYAEEDARDVGVYINLDREQLIQLATIALRLAQDA